MKKNILIPLFGGLILCSSLQAADALQIDRLAIVEMSAKVSAFLRKCQTNAQIETQGEWKAVHTFLSLLASESLNPQANFQQENVHYEADDSAEIFDADDDSTRTESPISSGHLISEILDTITFGKPEDSDFNSDVLRYYKQLPMRDDLAAGKFQNLINAVNSELNEEMDEKFTQDFLQWVIPVLAETI